MSTIAGVTGSGGQLSRSLFYWMISLQAVAGSQTPVRARKSHCGVRCFAFLRPMVPQPMLIAAPDLTVQNTARKILIHGLIMVLCGLIWGAVVAQTPFPRLALTAHIQFMVNGMLFAIMAVLLLTLPNQVGVRSSTIMRVSVWLAWLMLATEVANAWWGTTRILPLAAQQAGAKGGTAAQELTVALAHVLSSLGLIVAWSLLLAGFWRSPGRP